jgi:hypothetical protein
MQDEREYETNPLFIIAQFASKMKARGFKAPQCIILSPEDYRLAIEEAIREDPTQQVRLTPNNHLAFKYEGVVVMKGKYQAENSK